MLYIVARIEYDVVRRHHLFSVDEKRLIGRAFEIFAHARVEVEGAKGIFRGMRQEKIEGKSRNSSLLGMRS